LGDVSAFSFCQDKIITTGGEGGLLATSDDEVFERAWSYKDHGKDRGRSLAPPEEPGFRWLHDSFGSNFRLTEMQSVLGRRQLARLEEWAGRRNRNAGLLHDVLDGHPAIRIPRPPTADRHAYYRWTAYLLPEALSSGWSRARVIGEITSRGVPCFSGPCGEIYRERAFPKEWRPDGRLPVAAQLADTSLVLLVHPTLDDEAMLRSAEIVRDVLDEALASPGST
jgi:dTDP-4-amino-4,6-dideoxygalactose transaminase